MNSQMILIPDVRFDVCCLFFIFPGNMNHLFAGRILLAETSYSIERLMMNRSIEALHDDGKGSGAQLICMWDVNPSL